MPKSAERYGARPYASTSPIPTSTKIARARTRSTTSNGHSRYHRISTPSVQNDELTSGAGDVRKSASSGSSFAMASRIACETSPGTCVGPMTRTAKSSSAA